MTIRKNSISPVLSLCCTAMIFVLSMHLQAAEGDATKGERVFKKCGVCHQVSEVVDPAVIKIGPNLYDIVGRPAGAIESFDYSTAMKEKAGAGLVWEPDALREFLSKPKNYIPGTKMTFVGLRKKKDLDNILAYLSQFSAN